MAVQSTEIVTVLNIKAIIIHIINVCSAFFCVCDTFLVVVAIAVAALCLGVARQWLTSALLRFCLSNEMERGTEKKEPFFLLLLKRKKWIQKNMWLCFCCDFHDTDSTVRSRDRCWNLNWLFSIRFDFDVSSKRERQFSLIDYQCGMQWQRWTYNGNDDDE